MSLPKLHPDHLTLFVFGPGVGELVAVHAPPGAWLFVDGCSADSRGYAKQLLDYHGGEVALVVFTHPHLDHARGLEELVDEVTQDDPSTWPTFGMVPPPVATGAGKIDDPIMHYAGGVAQQAIAAISDRWDRHPPCRWEVQPGTARAVGDATVTALSPEGKVRSEARRKHLAGTDFDWNRLSSVLAVDWKGQRLLLGSDLVEKPGKGWTAVLRRDKSVAAHAALKVAHHGSKDAQHRPLLNRSKKTAPTPLWIITPYSSSNLPKFDGKGGVRELLRHAPTVHLTALPAAYSKQGGIGGYQVKRTKLDRRDSVRRDSPVPGFPDCFVVATFAPGQPQPTVTHGPGSLVVTR